MEDAELAARIAQEAGKMLLGLRARGDLAGAALGRAADRAADDLILAELRAGRPDDAILSEESPDDPARLAASRVWIVDPLDGTAEYGAGRDDWAVHVALAVDGRPAAGAVAVPARGLLLRSDAPPPLPPRRNGPPRLLVSRSRPPAAAARLAEALGAETVPMGSVGAKVAALLTGGGEAYVHVGGQGEWDNCAPVAIALAAGLHASRLDGAPLAYNRAPPSTPDLLVCRSDEAERILSLLATLP